MRLAPLLNVKRVGNVTVVGDRKCYDKWLKEVNSKESFLVMFWCRLHVQECICHRGGDVMCGISYSGKLP